MSDGGPSRFELSDQRQALLDAMLTGRAPGPARQPWWRIGDGVDEPGAPLSFAQERFWFLDRLQAGNPVYHVPALVPLHGPLDVSALRESLADVVARHEALRTTFDLEDGQPRQRVAPATDVPLPVVCCSGDDPPARRAEALGLAQAEVVKPFDLRTGPLLRAVLFRLDDGEHWLLITIHHIVCDAWSLQVFLRELAAGYEGRRSGRAATLPDLPLQYADYARWQRQWLQGDVLAKLTDYWKDKLLGAPSVLELPLDRPRPAMISFRGGLHAFAIPTAVSQALRELGRSEQTTAFMTMLAVFKVLLHRYTGQDDIVVGTPAASRDRSELEGLIGLFLNTLVLRTKLSGATTFREVLRRVRATTLEAYEHHDLPFEKLVEELQPDRNLNVNPLFQVLFVLQTGPAGAPAAEGEPAGPLSTGTAKFDLSLYLNDAGGEMSGVWEYNRDLFDPETIARWTEHLLTLVGSIVADPDAGVGDLPLLGRPEREQLAAWNRTRADYPAGLCAHALVEAQARATPHAPALVFAGETLSYRQVNGRANRVAHRLRSIGVGPESAVGICVERSVDMVVALLGVLKAGSAYVPLDPAYPSERLAYMLANARARVLIVQERLRSVVPGDYDGTLLVIDAEGALDRMPDDDPAPAARPDNLAYVIYTSGSTGLPKGVGMSHRALTNLTVWQNAINPLGPGDRTLQFNSFSFDVSVLEVLSTLSTAGTLVLVSEAVRRDSAALTELLARERIQRLFMPYTALAQLAEHAAGHDLGLVLRQVVSTGEPLQITPWLVRLFQGLPGCRLHNEYGPTETHFVTEHMLPDHEAAAWPMLPAVGRPIANAEVHILDARLERVPIGVVGELYAGGLAVARGYVGRPAMTAERFVPDPFGGEAGARLYRTGDLARFRPDGTVELLGRRDHQVKVRGFRIELGEIEIVLGEHPEVQAAVVAARGTDASNRHLVAYVVAKAERVPSAPELRRFLLDKLPEHMVPAVFVPMDRLPLGATGKVDRYRLPDPASRPAMAGDGRFVAPRNPIEEELARLWSRLLLREHVGVHDNFFALGGHSLTVVQLATRIREAFGVDVPLHRIFEAPTLGELALLILQLEAAQTDQGELARWLDEIEAEQDTTEDR